MNEVKVVVAHSECATLRVGDVFLKVDADQARIDVEVEAMTLAPGADPGSPVAQAAHARDRRGPGAWLSEMVGTWARHLSLLRRPQRAQ